MTIALISVLPLLPVPAAAAEQTAQPGSAHITGMKHVTDRWDKVSVYSPSMNKVIVNDVYKAPKAGVPVFYLLPGILEHHHRASTRGVAQIQESSKAPGARCWGSIATCTIATRPQ